MRSMRLIFGCGYLGLRVAKLWLDRGIAVAAVTRSEARAAELNRIGIKPVIADVTDPKSLQTLSDLQGVEGILYAVGLDRSSGKSMEEVYLDGLGHALDALKTVLPRRLVFVSSTSVYAQEDGLWVNETSPLTASSGSGKIVSLAEELLRSRAPAAVVLRFAGIYGPGRLLRQNPIEKGEPIPVEPDKWLNLVHVEDGAVAVDLAWDQAPPGSDYLIADGNPVTRGDFYRTLARLLGAPEPRFVPGIAGQRGGPDGAHRRIDSTRAQNQLGWIPRFANHEAGLRAILGQ